MQTFVALLRGINVGGRNILPMKDFREILEAQGCARVATYIQSGNAVFTYAGDSHELSKSIAKAIDDQFGFRPSVHIVSASDFSAIAAANPYREVEPEGKLVHVSFLRNKARDADETRLAALSANGEKFELTDRAFYLHAPAGIARSKLAANSEACLGVDATSRNRRTVEKIESLLKKIDPSI